ncbi:transposase, partial [Listeria monocytogenes]|nr:transposase [Listeria monocytogenes]
NNETTFNFDEYQKTYRGQMWVLMKNGIVDVEATNAYNAAVFGGEMPHESNEAQEEAELLQAIIQSVREGIDPVTGQEISKAQGFSITSGVIFYYVGGGYKGKKLKIPKKLLNNIKNRRSKTPKLSTLSEKEQLKLANKYKKKSPIAIPDNAKIKAQTKKAGYEQISYKWKDADGVTFEVRWHTRTPGAPKEQGNTFVVEKSIPGTADGKLRVEQIMVGTDKWVSRIEWEKAIFARKKGESTLEQDKMLTDGHWKE